MPLLPRQLREAAAAAAADAASSAATAADGSESESETEPLLEPADERDDDTRRDEDRIRRAPPPPGRPSPAAPTTVFPSPSPMPPRRRNSRGRPPPPRLWWLLQRSYAVGRLLVHCALLVFILAKSAAPLKELFTPAPWLAYYDDFFFVNAQGVFGFINSHRLNLVLSYTHDALPANRSARGGPETCRDTAGTIANGPDGRPLTCRTIRPYCASNLQLHEICPASCGVCARASWTDAALDSVTWRYLEFQNLPADPSRRPAFHSPYHYRLDWETWISTTASMEHYVERSGGARASLKPQMPQTTGLVDIPVPEHVSVLISKVLRGDTDAIGLLRTPEAELLLPRAKVAASSAPAGRTPPTAIKAVFYSYTFSDWAALWHEGRWWERRPLSKPVVFEAPTKAADPSRVRVSPPQRYWLVLGSVAGCTLALSSLLHDWCGLAVALWRLAAVGTYALAGALALAGDYPTSDAARRFIDAARAGLLLEPSAVGAPADSLGTLHSYLALFNSINLIVVVAGVARPWCRGCGVGGSVVERLRHHVSSGGRASLASSFAIHALLPVALHIMSRRATNNPSGG